jgi:hypothetical protein
MEVAEVIDVGRDFEVVDVVSGRGEKRQQGNNPAPLSAARRTGTSQDR